MNSPSAPVPDVSSIPIPERLARRPRDSRGYPIPASVQIDAQGKPDFRVTDVRQWQSLVSRRCCALCAEPLGRHLAFVGGPLSHKSRFFTDAAMHKECAEYALKVCPFLAAPRFKFANPEHLRVAEGQELVINGLASDTRPERFFLGITRGFQVVSVSGEIVLQAEPWESTTWWRQGEPMAQDEAPSTMTEPVPSADRSVSDERP